MFVVTLVRRRCPARARLLVPALLAALALTSPAAAQENAEAPTAGGAEASPAPELTEADFAKPMGPPDEFNRGTPRGSMYGFLKAANDGDYERAAQYMDLRRLPPDRQAEGPVLARKLKAVLDQTLWVDLPSLSDSNEGLPEADLPTWRDRVGTIQTAKGPLDVLIQRVPRQGDSVRIWKISSETVDAIPELYDEYGYGRLLEWLPDPFVSLQVFNLALWQWSGILLAVFASWLLSLGFSASAVRAIRPFVRRTATDLDDRIVKLVQGPVRLALWVVIFFASTALLRLPLVMRERMAHLAQALLIIAVSWTVLRLVDLAALRVRERMLRTQQGGAVHLVMPGKKAVKAAIILVAALAVLDNLGFNVTALLAGVGVGGIAIALAAQKTVENLFGGVTLFADQPIRVGDFCKFGDQVGTVEEIGLRSTRVRTLDRTVVTIPNAEFSALKLENFALRDQIRLYTVLGLRYETTAEQLRYVLARLREMLLAHPRISPDPARVRFVGYGAYSLDLEVFAYARTSDWNEFLGIREDVFLRIMDIVAEAGTGFAFPSQTTYVARDDGLDEKNAREAQDRVSAWRDEGKLPFPFFDAEQRERIEDTLDWPPEGSPGGRPRERRGAGGPAEADV